MKTVSLSNLDGRLVRIVGTIGREAGRRRLSAYVAGGTVRDIILGKKNLDLDVMVEGDAIRLAGVLARRWKALLTVHRRFGTACLHLPGGMRVDFSAARKERYAHPGALPAVRRGGLTEDLCRRDFTINAMAIAINPDCFGRLIDPFGGLRDLSKKKIRVLYDQSFIDDPTRILRAVRFEQRFRFRLDRRTLSLMKMAVLEEAVDTVKPPRYFAEFKKLLGEPDPLRCLKRLRHLGGLQFFGFKPAVCFRELSRMHRRIQGIRQKPLYRRHNRWWLVYFMGLMAEADDRTTENVLAKCHFTRDEREGIRQSRNAGGILKNLSGRNLPPSQVYRILRPLSGEVIVYLRVRTADAGVWRRIDRFLAEDMRVRLRITGEDLKRAGIAPGRQMGRALEDVLCLKIDKRVRTKREELNAALLALGRY